MVVSESISFLPAEQAERSTQHGLAASLIECMGRESAIHVCQVNGWDGVLEVLLSETQGAGPRERH